ncbi:MAG: MG2 domain-containing protein [Bacteroidota bacterium]
MPFQFSPSIRGVAQWEDSRTLIFIPSLDLPSGERFSASLNLKGILADIKPELETFNFQFATRTQHLQVEFASMELLNTTDSKLSGIVRTADFVSDKEMEELLTAELDGDDLDLDWKHNLKSKEHTFIIPTISRSQNEQEIEIRWNARPLGVDEVGRKALTLPPVGTFAPVATYTYDQPEAYIVVEFSEPLDHEQELKGLVSLEKTGIKTSIEGNRLLIYPNKKIVGPLELGLNRGIKSASGLSLKAKSSETVIFSETKPELRMIGKGTILPNTGKLPFIFEAKGLRAVDVRVIKIYEKNIPQFLQVNQLNGSNELKRVGQPVMMKRIDLGSNPDLDLNQWNRHSLDLASMIKSDPGALYEVAIGYRRSYAFYACSDEIGAEEDVNMLALEDDWYTFTQEEEDSYWDYYYYDEGGRNDPCKDDYYYAERMVKRNVLASDLGLIAKKGSGGAMIVVTNLQTTKPESGVSLEVYDYQHQLMQTITSDSKGMARTKIPRTPYLLVAKKGQQRGYLRLDDGSALSMSNFDTEGKTYHEGLKGYIYGERGVWRPGDDIYLTFLLEDKLGTLPNDHPVVFELIDPRGRSVEKTVSRSGQNGFYPFPTKTAATAPTGNYRAKVSVGGATFERTVKVETVVPNRLKMELDFGVKALSNKTRNQSTQLKAMWLHGAIARGLKAEVKASLKSVPTQFPKFSDYIFDDPVRKFQSEEQTLFEGNLTNEGTANVPANLSSNETAPGMLQANFSTRVFEPGGGFSVDRFSSPFHPYQTYAGIKTPKGDVARGMLLTDEDHVVNVVTVDTEGNPVSSSVEVTLYKLSWKWWWDKSQDNIGSYKGKVSGRELDSETITTSNGRGTYTLRVDYPEWGRYLVRAVDQNGHATGKIIYIDWPGWAGRAAEDGQGGAQMLSFTSDKPVYKVGETINLNIPTGFAGRALVSVESGTKVIEAHWLEAQKGNTKFSLKASGEMAPNVYINVSLLQPHAQTANDRPIRLYGVIPIKVEDPGTILNPEIAMADVLEPNSRVQIKVSEKDGGPMTYTLAVVDEGLLGLTRFKTPDPWSTFYAREALGIKTWDIYDHVLGAYGGEVKSLLNIGGGDGGEGPEGKKPDRFKPVVKFLGPFELKAGETKSHLINMPNYVGAVRTMIVASNGEGAYGKTEKSTPVRKALMVLGSLPRVVGPGENVRLPVTVFSTEDGSKVVNVKVETGKRMLVDGAEKQVVRFYNAGEKMAYFNLGVLSSLGTGHVKITAQSGGDVAVYETDIQVRVPNPVIYESFSKSLEKNQNWAQAITPIGMRGTRAGMVEVSAIPPLNLGKRLEYLIRYPYGCIEQTTSSVFPQVRLATLLDLTTPQKENIDKNIRAGIKRLRGFQLASGGMSYWPGNGDASDWGTNYAGHFMLEAEMAGYSLPDGFKDKWINYQRKEAQNWNGGDGASALTQAYRLYLLSLAKAPDLGSMNRMRQSGDYSPVVRWNLAAAYYLAGQEKVARDMVTTLSQEVAVYQELGGTYGSQVRDQAVILQALSHMEMRDRAGTLVKAISDRLSSDQWLNTQATAYSLIAMAKYVGEEGFSEKVAFSYRLGKGKWQNVKSDKPMWQLALAEADLADLEVKNNAGGMLFARVIIEGIPEKGAVTDAANGLAMTVNYFDMAGKTIDPAQLAQGTDFKAVVTVKNTGQRDYEEMVLNQIFPSGWEIHNTRLDGGSAGGDTPEYQDIRDDRVYSFYDLKRGQSKTFNVLLNASYLGRFYLPSVSSDAMYDHSIQARKAGQWVNVVEAGGN